jgi:hypothetical protein
MRFLEPAEKSTTPSHILMSFLSNFSWGEDNIGPRQKSEELHVMCNILQFLGQNFLTPACRSGTVEGKEKMIS